MIQRIQSVYLGATALLSVILFFISFAVVFPKDTPANITTLSVLSFDSGNAAITKPASYSGLLVLNVLTLLITIYAIFKYKNRGQQLKLSRLAVFTSLLLLGGMFLFADVVKHKMEAPQVSYMMYGIVLPIFQAVFCVLASSAIKKDDDLVRSADRLR